MGKQASKKKSEHEPAVTYPDDGEPIAVFVGSTTIQGWVKPCHYEEATKSVISDEPPQPTTIIDPETGEIKGRGPVRPGQSRFYCKFEDVTQWLQESDWNLLATTNSRLPWSTPVKRGPSVNDDEKLWKALLKEKNIIDAAEREDRRWKSANKRYEYHMGIFTQMLERAKSNDECIVICRDMLDPNKSFAYQDPVFKQLEEGRIVFGTYLTIVQQQLHFRERVKMEEHAKPRIPPAELPFRSNWLGKQEDLRVEIGRLQEHGIVTFEEYRGKPRWVWTTSVQDLGLYLLRLSALKWVSSNKLYARTSDELLFEERKAGKRNLVSHSGTDKVKTARDNASRGWQQQPGKAAQREIAKGTEAMEKLLNELPKP